MQRVQRRPIDAQGVRTWRAFSNASAALHVNLLSPARLTLCIHRIILCRLVCSLLLSRSAQTHPAAMAPKTAEKKVAAKAVTKKAGKKGGKKKGVESWKIYIYKVCCLLGCLRSGCGPGALNC